MGEAWTKPGEGWEKVGSPEDVVDINREKADALWANLGNLQNLYQQQMGGFFQPGGGFGEIWNAISGAASPLQQGLAQYHQQYLPQMVEQGIAGVQQLGGAHSGLAGKIAAQTGAQSAMEMQNQMMQAQLGMLGPLAQQQMGGQFGMMGDVLGHQARAGESVYWQPTYAYDPDQPGWLQGALTGGLQGGLAGLAAGGPWGALAGALGGGVLGGMSPGQQQWGTGLLAQGGLMNMKGPWQEDWVPRSQRQQQPIYGQWPGGQGSTNWWDYSMLNPMVSGGGQAPVNWWDALYGTTMRR